MNGRNSIQPKQPNIVRDKKGNVIHVAHGHSLKVNTCANEQTLYEINRCQLFFRVIKGKSKNPYVIAHATVALTDDDKLLKEVHDQLHACKK